MAPVVGTTSYGYTDMGNKANPGERNYQVHLDAELVGELADIMAFLDRENALRKTYAAEAVRFAITSCRSELVEMGYISDSRPEPMQNRKVV